MSSFVLALAFLLGSAQVLAAAPEPTPFVTTKNFRFFGDEDVEGTLERLAATAEERLQISCQKIDACGRLKRPIDIWVAADAERFAATFPDENPMSEWAAGVTFLEAQRIVLRRHGSAVFTLQETFDHEVAHVLAHTFRPSAATEASGRALPRWFAEGLAIWQADEALAGRLNEAMNAAATDDLLTFDELDQHFPNEGKRVPIAYAQSALFVRKLVRMAGPMSLSAVLHDIARGVSFDAAFQARFRAPPRDLFEIAKEELEETSSVFSLFADGNFLWSLVTVLFIGVAWWRLRDRKLQMRRLAESEEQRISEEELALLPPEERRPRDDLLN